MLSDYNSLVKNKNFVLLWLSQTFSQLTIHIMNFIILIRLFEQTGSPIANSLLWVAYSLPALLIGPIAATSVDMLSKKNVLRYTNFLQSFVILFYALISPVSIFLLYFVVLVYSFLNQFYVPAELSMVPELVKKNQLPHANGVFFITQQSALIVGFGVAGVLLRYFGFQNSLFICAVFIFIAFVSVSFLPKTKAVDDVPKQIEKGFTKFFQRIFEGYRFIKGNRSILTAFLLMIGLQVALAVITINVPLIAEELFRVDIDLSGIFIVVPAAVGAGIGGFYVPRLLKKGVRKMFFIDYSFKYITLAFLLITFLIPILTTITAVIVGMILIAILGFSFVSILIPSQTFLQEKTPSKMRGRVFGNFWFLVTIATMFPVITSGAVVEIFGIKILTFFLSATSFTVLILIRRYGEKFVKNGFNISQ